MRTTTTLLAALCLLLAPAASVAAQQEDEASYETEISDDRAAIEIEREIGDEETSTEISFDTTKGDFEAKFERENASMEREAKLEAKLHQLVEYEDANGDGRYDSGDSVASAWKLSPDARNVSGTNNGTVEWDALTSTNVTTENGTNGTLIQGVATFPEQDAVAGVLGNLAQDEERTFRVDIYVFGEPVEMNGTHVGPMEVKIDFRIDNYPYTSEDTELALLTETKSEQELEVETDENDEDEDEDDEDDPDEAGVRVPHNLDEYQVNLAFTWAKTATVDGTETTVDTTTLEEKNETESEDDEVESSTEKLFALSYERGDTIVHDPKIGANAQSGTMSDGFDSVNGAPGFGLLAAISTLAGLAVLARTRTR